jgi:hypothetical protein
LTQDEQQPTSSKDIPATTRSNKKNKAYYGKMLTIFLANNLEFHCSSCHHPIYYGDAYCEHCNGDIVWDFNRTAIMRKLAIRSSKGQLTCPNDECGAMIELGWHNCAYCGLSIKDVLESTPIFD